MVCACWPEKIDNLCRTWITAGGHLLDCDGETATNSVSVETVAVEQVVSHMQWHRAPFDWFLSCKSLWKSHQEERTLFLSRISNSWLTQLQNDSGRIANQDVVNHLAKYGHCECKFTPGLLSHETRSIQFKLIVNDFAAEWENQEDFDHPLHSSETKCTMTCDMDGKQCAGMHLDWNHDTCEVICSMDQCI